MAKQRRTPPGKGGDYIEHEEVGGKTPSPARNEPIDVEAEQEKALVKKIDGELQRFTLADKGIAALQEQYGSLVIADVNDKAGYEATKDAWQDVRGKRVQIEDKGLEIRGNYNRINKAISAEEKRLLALITPLEQRLEKAWREIDRQKDAEKERKRREEEDRLQDRIRQLTDEGMVFADGYYQLGGTVSTDVATLRPMKQEQFEKLLGIVRAKSAELKQQREREEQERARQKEELEQRQREQREAQEKLDREREELERQKEAMRKQLLDMRILRFEALGMKRIGHALTHDTGLTVHTVLLDEVAHANEEELVAMLEDSKDRIMTNIAEKVVHDKQEKERKEALEAKRKLIHSLFAETGMRYDPSPDAYIFHNPKLALSHYVKYLLDRTEEELRALALEVRASIDKAKRNQEEEEERQKKKQEEERQAALSDAQKMRNYLLKLQAVEAPQMRSEEYAEKLAAFSSKFQKLYTAYVPLQEAAKA